LTIFHDLWNFLENDLDDDVCNAHTGTTKKRRRQDTMSPEELIAHRERDKTRKRSQRDKETSTERNRRLQLQQERLARQSEEHRVRRLQLQQERDQERLARQSEEDRVRRLQLQQERLARQSEEDRVRRLQLRLVISRTNMCIFVACKCIDLMLMLSTKKTMISKEEDYEEEKKTEILRTGHWTTLKWKYF
jgi:hypothetical protein